MGKSDSLYKYTNLEYVNSSLYNGIYASPIQSLNDPYESFDMTTSDDYRVVCLSRSRNKKLMWSHYANGHRGCSIKISLPQSYGTDICPLKRVEYRGKFFSRSELSEKDRIDSLYIKDKKWNYELEVRAVYHNGCELFPYWKKYRGNVFLKANIIQIDFGCFSQYDSHYLDALIAIRDYNMNHNKQIKVRKYKMSNKQYRFIIDDSFNYIEEIAKIINEHEI